MKTAAVICEYNPMHDGHRAQLCAIRRRMGEDAAVLCLMSGDFVQRGEPAVYEKYDRARAAIGGGADLVLELPYPWSAAVAEHFAFGALSILKDLGCVDALFFGSEGKDENELRTVARRLSDPAFAARFQVLRRQNRNLSHPKLRDLCYKDLYGEIPALSSNEILGAEYLKNAEKLRCPFTLCALPMLEGASASDLRTKICLSEDPDAAFLACGERALLAALRLSGEKNRFARAAEKAADLPSLFAEVRCSSDTDARLKRELLATVLCSAGAEREKPAFTVLLAANDRGKALLAKLRREGGLPVVVKQARAPRDPRAQAQYALYRKARELYPAFMRAPLPPARLLTKAPFIAVERKNEKQKNEKTLAT